MRDFSELIVMKFGGTSVGSADRIKYVASLIEDDRFKIVVLSAMSGVTNTLVEISDHFAHSNVQGALSLIDELEQKYYHTIDALYASKESQTLAKVFVDEKMGFLRSFETERLFSDYETKQVLGQGEIISVRMMELYLREQGKNPIRLSALDFICTDQYGEPDFPRIQDRLLQTIADYPTETLFLTEGYICLNAYSEMDNLKRGGSDYTATIIGSVLDAKEIQIWTDIDGMHNNDPRVVEHTRPVRTLHYDEASELAYFGAKILHPSCIIPAKMANVPVKLLSTMEPEAKGTLISNRMDEGALKAIAAKDGVTVLRIRSTRLLLSYGFLRKVFEVFEANRTPIDMVTTSEVSVSVSITDTDRLEDILANLRRFSTVTLDYPMTILCIAGDLNWKNVGFESRVIEAVKDLPVRMISFGGSDHNVSVVVRAEDKELAMNQLHKRLFMEPEDE